MIADFSDPAVIPLPWDGIGEKFRDVLIRTMHNEDTFVVLSDPTINESLATIDRQSLQDRDVEFAVLHDQINGARFLVSGVVTDFTHSSELPRQSQRWRLFKRRNEAVVAVKISVIDTLQGRVIASDHIIETASASKRPIEETYGSVDFDSYLFWSTPLGKATKEAVESITAYLEKIIPTTDDAIHISEEGEGRLVKIDAPRGTALVRGATYYIYVLESGELELRPLRDPDTGLPLEVRIERSRRGHSTGMIFGRKPTGVQLAGAVLRYDPPVGP